MDNKAIEIINKAFNKAGGIGEYEGLTMPDYNPKKQSNYSIRYMMGIVGRNFIRFTTKEIDKLILEYRKTNDEIILTALFENYINMVIHITKKYQTKASSIKRGNGNSYSYDEDLTQEAMLILDKCIKKYTIYEDGRRSSFSSFFVGELRNNCIETCRKKYFDVVKVPSTVYKQYRKTILNTDTVVPQNELGMYQRTGACISEYDENTKFKDNNFDGIEKNLFYEYSLDCNHKNGEEAVIEMLERNIPNKKDFYIFCLITGIGCRSKIKSVDIANLLNVSKPAISKRLKKIKEHLSKCQDIKELYQYYKDKNILS